MDDNSPHDEETFGALEPEDALDAFNDETFGGGGLGEEWKEDAHEELAALTEQERVAMKQSNDFFNFGSDGEELGGELEEALETGLRENGAGGGGVGDSRERVVHRMDQLSLQAGLPPAPLTVQTGQVPGQPGHYHHLQHQQQLHYHHVQPQPPPLHHHHQQQQFPLLPPSAFGATPGNIPQPGLEEFSHRLPHGGGITGPVQYQDPAIMSLSKLPPALPTGAPLREQYHQYQPQPRPAFSPPTVPGMKTLADIEAEMMYGPPRHQAPPQGQPPMMVDRGGHVGHINPALHNLNYPGMRDRQHQHQPPPHHHQPPQQQQFRHSPGLTNQQQLQQGLQQQKLGQHHRGQRPQFDGSRRRNENNFNENRDQYYDRRGDGGQGRRGYNDPNRMNEETFGSTAVREQREQYNKEVGDQSVTRRDLMPGHVHTLGILRHSRSRHDRHNHETFGDDDNTDPHEGLAVNPTGDPVLDARMVEEEEEMARRRKHYANSEDEYAGLMSQKDKQWIINIQLNQLKCDNPYVDDYYYTMYQARKEEQRNKDDNRAGNHLLLNESLGDLQPSYTPTQFENSLGKLQCVTVKAPRQIIDVGVVRVTDNNTSVRCADSPVVGEGAAVIISDRKPAGEYKLLLMRIEVLYKALLDLEADQLKLNALPTGAPLREQIAGEEVTHLNILQSGLANSELVQDCLAVAKGRNLVLRGLGKVRPSSVILNTILGNLHLVARNDGQDLSFWSMLAKHIDNESLEMLEPAASNLISLKTKHKKSLVSTRLGSTAILTLILKASLETGKTNNNMNTWTVLAQTLLNLVAEGAKLGEFLAKFNLSEETLDNLLSLDNKLKPAWALIKDLSSSVELAVSS